MSAVRSVSVAPLPPLRLAQSPAHAQTIKADAPTFEEAGVPGMIAQNGLGIMGPAKLPRPIVERLDAEIIKIVRTPDVLQRFAVSAIAPVLNTPEAFTHTLETGYARWGKVVRSAGIEPEGGP